MRIFLLSIFLVSTALAQFSLPLEGYYRPGAYMPVASGGERGAMLRAPGGVCTRAAASPGVLPVLALSTSENPLEVNDQQLPLHPLADDQRLVGFTTRDDSLLAALLPSEHLIPVQLNPTDPLPGSPLAWDSLDAVVLDSIDPKRIAPLLATGMIIAIRSEAPPDKTWPWKKLGDAWVLRPTIDQPATTDASAYEPTYSWKPSHSAATRQLIFILAVLVCCAMFGMALWRSRWSVPVLIVFALLFTAGFVGWRARRTDVMTMMRQQQTTGEWTILDRWTFQMSPTSAHVEFESDGMTWPIFASPAHAGSLHLVIDCDANGNPRRFSYDLPANARMAFVTRTLSPSR